MPTVITGTDGINQVQAGAVESGDLAAGAIGSGDLPAGSVIQVVHTVVRPSITTTSSSPVDLGLSTSITSNSVNSSFLLIATIHAEHENPTSGYGLIFMRDTSEIRSPGDYYEVYIGNDPNLDGGRTKSTFQYLDSPNFEGVISYNVKTEIYNNNTMRFGENLYDCNLTIMEIAG